MRFVPSIPAVSLSPIWSLDASALLYPECVRRHARHSSQRNREESAEGIVASSRVRDGRKHLSYGLCFGPHRRNPLNSQSLISHLTNSNGCGNLFTKVLLTVSPFRPSLLPQPRVSSPIFDFVGPLFSYSYELLFSHLLCFDNHLNCPGVYSSSVHRNTSPPLRFDTPVANPIFSAACRLFVSLGSLFRTRLLCFQELAASFAKNRGVGIPAKNRPCGIRPSDASEICVMGIAYHE